MIINFYYSFRRVAAPDSGYEEGFFYFVDDFERGKELVQIKLDKLFWTALLRCHFRRDCFLSRKKRCCYSAVLQFIFSKIWRITWKNLEER